MSETANLEKVDAVEDRADRSTPVTPTPYAAPRLMEIGSTTRMLRGGGGGAGQDCRYYYYYTTGPYGC